MNNLDDLRKAFPMIEFTDFGGYLKEEKTATLGVFKPALEALKAHDFPDEEKEVLNRALEMLEGDPQFELELLPERFMMLTIMYAISRIEICELEKAKENK